MKVLTFNNLQFFYMLILL